MANIIFFEGFNDANSDLIKLDSSYWLSSNTSKISFGTGRTSNSLLIDNRPQGSGIASNYTLTLSNFDDPLVSYSGFAVGFALCESYGVRTNNDSPPLYNENLISFHDNSGEVLRIDVIKTTFNSSNSLGLGIYQSGILVDTYDFKNVPGASWSYYEYNGYISISEPAHIQVYVDAKNNNQIGIQFSANTSYDTWLLNTSNNIYTSITGFNNLDKIIFYSNNSNFGAESTYRTNIDDVYITAGNSDSECLLGYNTRIYPLPLDYFSYGLTPNDWKAHNNNSGNNYYYLNSNDGDSTYAYSSSSGDISIFNISDLSISAPTGIGGIKIKNVIKKTGGPNLNFTNVIRSGETESIFNVGNTHSISNITYDQKNSFVFINPITSGSWTKEDIDNMQIGIKNLGS